MTASTATRPQIVAFAEAVRAALGDLPQEEIDDLTDGLEADLSERADDAAPGTEDFGDPDLYADELRAAAGLPERSASRHGVPTRRSMGESVRSAGRRSVTAIRSTAFGSGLLDGFIAVRPVWWVLRGWAIYHVLVTVYRLLLSPSGNPPFAILPPVGPGGVVLLALVVVSVQWGRGRWLPKPWLEDAKAVLSVIAGIALLVLVPAAIDSGSRYASLAASDGSAPYQPPGLTLEGQPLGNIFAYDADGEPLTDVQLFDQDGEPLDLVGRSDIPVDWTYAPDGMSILVPSGSVPGRVGWNVYPLSEASNEDLGYGVEPDGAIDPSDIDPASPPFVRVQPLASREEQEDTVTSDPFGSDEAASDPTASDPSPSPSAWPVPTP